MSPLNGIVLTSATVVASPALWSSLVKQTMPLDVGLTRYLIAVGICWALFSLVAEFALPSPGAIKPRPPEKPKADEQTGQPETP
ncbi:MAG: hypothetical protein JWQ32_28 [Marmoricola sp.]|nr:hypothetical protein [Marmoricola sp.]